MSRTWRLLAMLGLALASAACAPRLQGPTPSRDFFSLHVSETTFWQQPPDLHLPAQFPTSAVLTVRVRDARGQPVDGVAVTFQAEPAWAAVSPSRTLTRAGIARAVLHASGTGVVRVRASVDTAVQEVRIAVQPPYSVRETGS